MMIWCCTRTWTEVLVRSHNFLSLYLDRSQIQNLIAAKLPAHKIQKFHTLPNSHSTPVEMTAKSVGGGVCPSFFWITTSLAPETLPKKIISLRPPTGTSQVPLSPTSTTTAPEHPRRTSLAYPSPRDPRHPAACRSRFIDAVINRTGSSPPNLETIYSSSSLPQSLQLRYRPPHRSRFAGSVVHRIGSSSPTPSSTAPDRLHRHLHAWTGSTSPTLCLMLTYLNSSTVAFLLLACKFLFNLGGTCLCSRLAVTFCRWDE